MTDMPTTALELRDVTLEYRMRRSFFRHSFRRALDGVSFDVEKGETVGIIGGNGSGKSTLLRVLGGIYRPNSGHIACWCENIMMLSLGLGFDPELSGRDNALIGGVLLGGRRREVKQRVDQMIAFAELEEQSKDPVKTYSSGMKARLGFSVALTMEADLLLIDEVLGVGDQAFQQKAKAAMLSRINSEQTVVFVSHSLAMVTQLCNRVVWLERGRVRQQGSAVDIVEAYKIEQQNKT
ncbi:ABC transporter ATP-binding protein [Lamprobacter modestohalophilus]|nr:ATP-binding cassette domain-containing protein [Lamprobacter modestohalophilus]